MMFGLARGRVAPVDLNKPLDLINGAPPMGWNHPGNFPALQSQPDDQAPAADPPEEAFIWADGGRRMTPAQIAIAHNLAGKQMATGSDYSPVQHWTQGMARVANGLIGGLEERRARKAEEANAAEGRVVARALMDPAANAGQTGAPREAILAALTNPYVGDDVRAAAGKLFDQDIEANKPQYFTSGNDRIGYDPRTHQATVLYKGQSDAENYATSLGYEPGTPEHSTAMQDYVLRANGPTAFGYDVDLENTRQDNRETLEGVRQRDRSLRQTPTYSNLHPRPSGGRDNPAAHPPTMAGTMAPILAKVSRGETLTPSEQQAWNMYRPPSRKPAGGGSSPSGAAHVATDPTTGKKVLWNGKAWVPAG